MMNKLAASILLLSTIKTWFQLSRTTLLALLGLGTEYLESKPKWSSYSKTMNQNNNKQASSTPASTGKPTRNKKEKKIVVDKRK